jgi:serine/threonine-protein kinase
VSARAIRDLSGSTLGAYRLDALIGTGGMASVYRGYDTNLQREVAIKVLAAHAAVEPGFVERFRQEARLIASLRHPHIVHVYDMGEADGAVYMVQELLPGPTLGAHIHDVAQRGMRLERQEIVTIIAHLASALDAAHAAGIVHRDVKPANALWNAVGALVLTDFGIAKNTLASVHHTQMGVVLGTPAYLAPEQAQGLLATLASDIYALGVVLYELIAGEVPFTGVTPMQVLLGHLHEPPPPLVAQRPGLPPAVEDVVQRALAKEPATRFASAGELAQALEQAWPLASSSAGHPTIADLHSQATRVWQPPDPVPLDVPQPEPLPSMSPPQLPQPPRFAGSPRRLLPALGVLLLLLFLAGAVLAFRAERQEAASAPGTQEAAVQQTALPGPTTLEATPAADAFAQLQTLVEAGMAAGKAGASGEQLRQQLGEAQRAAASGDRGKAANKLHQMKETVLAGVGKGEIAPDFAQQLLRAVDALENSNAIP